MVYKYFNPNPSNLSVGDCVIRAISKITSKDMYEGYSGNSKEEVVHKLKEMMDESDKPEVKKAISECVAVLEK